MKLIISHDIFCNTSIFKRIVNEKGKIMVVQNHLNSSQCYFRLATAFSFHLPFWRYKVPTLTKRSFSTFDISFKIVMKLFSFDFS